MIKLEKYFILFKIKFVLDIVVTKIIKKKNSRCKNEFIKNY